MITDEPSKPVDIGGLTDAFLVAVKTTCDSISRNAIESAVDLLYDAWKNEKRVFVIGNGGSASTATHLACDLAKNVSIHGKRGLKAMALNDNVPLVSALTNDAGFDNIFTEQLQNWLEKGDLVVALSVHGGVGRDRADPWSQNIMKALEFAQSHGAKTLAITGFDGGAMKNMVDVWINTPAMETFQVEALHVVVHHLLCECLKSRINVS